MAFAEARAAWQRAANRCFVQEDAKRAPKLASSFAPSAIEAELEPSNAAASQQIASTVFVLFDPEPSYYNLSPTSRWWLKMQPDYGCGRGSLDKQLNVVDGDEGRCLFKETSENFLSGESDFVMVDQLPTVESAFGGDCSSKEENFRTSSYGMDCSVHHKSGNEVTCRNKGEGVIEALVSSNDKLFDLDASWGGVEKSGPWWRTDAEELALLVSQRSLSLVENCDLPFPQNSYARKGLNADRNSFCQHKYFTSSVQESLVEPSRFLSSNDSTGGKMAGCISLPKQRLPSESQSVTTNGDSPNTNRLGEDTAKLLEALRHSQTRARQSEKAATEAYAEKEHIVKLLLRQASHLFAYKQWFQLLLLENNTYLQVQSHKSQAASPLYPVASPHYKPPSKRRKSPQHSAWDIGKYAIAFAWGIGLVSAGLILGWGIAWILPPL